MTKRTRNKIYQKKSKKQTPKILTITQEDLRLQPNDINVYRSGLKLLQEAVDGLVKVEKKIKPLDKDISMRLQFSLHQIVKATQDIGEFVEILMEDHGFLLNSVLDNGEENKIKL